MTFLSISNHRVIVNPFTTFSVNNSAKLRRAFVKKYGTSEFNPSSFVALPSFVPHPKTNYLKQKYSH